MSEERKMDSGVDKSHPETKTGRETKVSSAVPERVEGEINPSSPGDTGTTPGSNAKVG